MQFVKSKWSIKALHRLIVTSSTWRQSSQIRNPKAAAIDPQNELLWRFNGRWLEAEAVRDSVLSFSGRLNPEHYGLPIFPPLPDDIEERVKYTNTKWDTQHGPDGRKRSIYIYQQRTLSLRCATKPDYGADLRSLRCRHWLYSTATWSMRNQSTSLSESESRPGPTSTGRWISPFALWFPGYPPTMNERGCVRWLSRRTRRNRGSAACVGP